MRKHLRRELTQQLGLIGLRQSSQAAAPLATQFKPQRGEKHQKGNILLKDTINALPSRIPHRTKPIPRNRASECAGEIRHDEPHRPTAQPADQAPELAVRPRLLALGHAFLPQHLLEHAPELIIAEALLFGRVGGPAPEKGPGEPTPSTCVWWRARDLFLFPFFFFFGI